MRGFKIMYRDGQSDIINSDNGTSSGTIDFEQYDEFVGITVASVSDSETKPRRIGFTLMRDNQSPSMRAEFPPLPELFKYQVYQTLPVGHEFTYSETWPLTASLQNRNDVANMRLTQISFSRWGENDYDLSGIKLKNNSNQESDVIGRTKYALETLDLKTN